MQDPTRTSGEQLTPAWVCQKSVLSLNGSIPPIGDRAAIASQRVFDPSDQSIRKPVKSDCSNRAPENGDLFGHRLRRQAHCADSTVFIGFDQLFSASARCLRAGLLQNKPQVRLNSCRGAKPFGIRGRFSIRKLRRIISLTSAPYHCRAYLILHHTQIP
jgi:hypothetical protein